MGDFNGDGKMDGFEHHITNELSKGSGSGGGGGDWAPLSFILKMIGMILLGIVAIGTEGSFSAGAWILLVGWIVIELVKFSR